MVDASSGNVQSPGTDPTRVWSVNDSTQKLAVQPVRALINLVGSRETTHDTLRGIIQSGVRTIITKQTNVSANYAAPLVRIQSYELPSECPRQNKRQPRASSTGTANDGFLKRNFFTALAYNKPAVTIFVFDWRDWAKQFSTGEEFVWKQHEQLILMQIKQHSEVWLKDLSVPSKYIIIVLFPLAQPGSPVQYNIDQCMQSFRKAVQLNGDDNIKSSNYFLSNGFEALKTSMQKKFVKNVHELVVSYYREKKNNIKRKQKKLIVGQVPHIRYGMHIALYQLITSNDFQKSIDKLEASYQLLKQANFGAVQSRFGNEEKRDNADVIAMVILGLLLQSNQLPKFLEFYRNHFRSFQKEMNTLRTELRPEEMKWRACWFHMMGTLLQRYYSQQGGLYMSQKQWHTQQSLDFFPGHYFLNAMLQLIGRQQELDRIKLDCLATNKQVYDLKVLDCISKSSSSFLGKDYEVHDVSNGGKILRVGDRLYDEYLTQYRLYEENQVHLGGFILSAGQVAIGYYKQRSQLMKGPTGSLYQRTVNFINYHLSELLDRQGRDEDLSDIFGPSSLTEAAPQVTTLEKQKYRRTIQSQLIKEKWTTEAVTLLEKSKANSSSLEEYFSNEMKVLLHAHSLKSHKRHQRMMELIEKVQSERVGPDQEPVKLTGIVQGTSLIWARARFQHSRIQINKFNKLKLEVFSRLTQPIKIAKLTIMMSQVDLNQEIDFKHDDSLQENYIVLSKTTPIRLERNFYLKQEDDQIGQIMLNQIMLEVAPKKAANIIVDTGDVVPLPQNKLFFSISPYLAPEDSLIDLSTSNTHSTNKKRLVKRLPHPIMYSIDPLPQKIKIESILSDAKDQALLGDPYDLKLKLTMLEDVKLQSLKCTFQSFTTEAIGNEDLDYRKKQDNDLLAQDGMVDISLSQSPVKNSGEAKINDMQSRMSASMFDPNMTQFYQCARSMISSQSLMAHASTSMFIGADPMIGVAVLKRTKTGAGASDSVRKTNFSILDDVKELDEDEEIQPVELYYSLGQATSLKSEKSHQALRAIAINEKDREGHDREIELLNEHGQLDSLNLRMIFYQEDGKKLTLRFQYEFTQNQGIEDEATHLKAFDYSVKVRAQSPFKVEWQVKSQDCFLASLQHFYYAQLGQPDQVRKFLNQAIKTSIFDQSNQLPIGEEVKALTGIMVAPEEQHCWLVCSLTSQAQYRDINLRNIRLHLNPEIADFIEVLDSQGCETGTQKRGELGEETSEEDLLCIEPGETYQVIFKLNIKKVQLARSFIAPDEDLDPFKEFSYSGTKVADGAKDSTASLSEQVNYLKKLYKLQQINIFAELHFEWSSFEAKEDIEDLIDLGEEKNRKVNSMIPCCVGSPAMNFITRPIQVKIRNIREIHQVKLHEPFTVEYEISNLSGKVISAMAELQTLYDGPSKFPFMIAGEVKSRLHLMPNAEEGYILRYTLFPQVLGINLLPKLTISDFFVTNVQLIKDFTVKVSITST